MNPAASLPEGRAGQALAAGVALLAALLVWFGVIAPALGWYAGRAEDLHTARLELAHMRALRASVPALRDEVARSAAQSTGQDVLLAGDSDAIAGANLQAALNDLATQSGNSLDSAENTAPQQTGALRRIGVAVTLSTTWPDLVAFLTAIDTARPRMVVDDLSVTADSAPDVRQDVSLQASFTVAAFRAGTSP